MSSPLTDEMIRDSGYALVAVASVAYAEAELALARIFASAQDHGMTMDDLVTASGRSEQFIAELLEAVDH